MSIDFQKILKALGQPGAIIAVWTPDSLTRLEKDFLEGKPYPGPQKRPALKDVGEGAVALAVKEKKYRGLTCRHCHEAFESLRSRGQHERFCKKNTAVRISTGHNWTDADDVYLATSGDSKEEKMRKLGVTRRALECRMTLIRKRGKGSAPKYGRGHPCFTDEEKAYILAHWDDAVSVVAKHLGKKTRSVWDIKYRMEKKGLTGETGGPTAATISAGTAITAADGLFNRAEGNLIATVTAAPPEKKPTFFESVMSRLKGPPLPDNFDPKQRFGVGAWVYHAPARKCGRIMALDQYADKAEIFIDGRTQYFTYRAAQFMFNEMIAKVK